MWSIKDVTDRLRVMVGGRRGDVSTGHGDSQLRQEPEVARCGHFPLIPRKDDTVIHMPWRGEVLFLSVSFTSAKTEIMRSNRFVCQSVCLSTRTITAKVISRFH